jgi:hypothetical protein
MPLFNKVGTQLRFHTISGKNEALTIAHIIQRCQKFFKFPTPTPSEDDIEKMVEGDKK